MLLNFKKAGYLNLWLIFTFISTQAAPTIYENFRGFNNHIPVSGKLSEFAFLFHNDSIHRLDFKNPDEKKGLKPWIAPAILVSTGTTLHFMTGLKENIRDFAQENLAYNGSIDDYAYYAPLATVFVLDAFNIEPKKNFGNRTAIALKSILVNSLITDGLKSWFNVTRPNVGKHSLPSGHTSSAFTFAHFMHRELGDKSSWYSVGAYSCATMVGIMRIAKNAHWISDVFMGAGVGIFSTELIYLTHQYKWDNEHIRNLQIFPFHVGPQTGMTLVYTF